MKKIKLYIMLLILFVISIQILLNAYIYFVKKNLLRSFLSGVKSGIALYLPPQRLVFVKLNYISENAEGKLSTVIVEFNISKILEKKFLIDKLYIKNGFVKIKAVNTAATELDEDMIEKTLRRLLHNFPNSIKIKNIKIIFNNTSFNLSKLSAQRILPNKIYSTVEGETSGYNFISNIAVDCNTLKFLAKGEVTFPSVLKLLTSYYVSFEVLGNCLLQEFKDYKVSLVKGRDKVVTSYGKFRIRPFEVKGVTESEIVRSTFDIVSKESKLSFTYDGFLNIKKSIVEKLDVKKLGDLKIRVTYTKDTSGYSTVAYVKGQHLTGGFTIVNDTGNFRFNINKKKISGELFYDPGQKLFLVKDNRGGKIINLKLAFSENREIISDGIFFGYTLLSSFKLQRDGRFVNISLTKADVEDIKLKFLSAASSTTIFLSYENRRTDTRVISELINEEDNKTNFEISCENLYYLNSRLSFSIAGMLEKDTERQYLCTLRLTNFNIGKHKIVDSMTFSGSFKNDILKIFGESVDGVISVNGYWNIRTNISKFVTVVSKKDAKLDHLTTKNIVAKIFIEKQRIVNIYGEYSLNDIAYKRTSILTKTTGKFSYDWNNKRLTLNGNISLSPDSRGSYNLDFIPKEKKIYLKLYNLYLTSIQFSPIIGLELDITDNNNIFVKGKIQDEASEILISSGTFLISDKMLFLSAKIKNFAIRKSNIIGNLESIFNFQTDRLVEIKMIFKNLWINNYSIDELVTRCLIYLDRNLVSFVPLDKDRINRTASIVGDIVIESEGLKFNDFEVRLYENRQFYCDGEIGKKGELLHIKLNKFPMEVLSAIFKITLPVMSGDISADYVVITVDPEKRQYHYNGQFNVNDLDFASLRIQQVYGKTSSYKDYLNIEELKFVFKPENSMLLKGYYNIKNQDMNFMLNTQNCDLSIFDGFMDIIKSAKGPLLVNLKFKGKTREPKVYGYIHIPKGKVIFGKYGKYLNNVSVRINFLEDEIKIEKFTGDYEQTRLDLAGEYNINNGRYIFKIKTTDGNGIFISIPQLSYSPSEMLKIISRKSFVSSGDLHFDLIVKRNKKDEIPTVTGKVIMNNTRFTYPGTEGKKISNVDEFYYDITLTAGNNVWFENESLSASILGQVNFKYGQGMKKSDVNGEIQSSRGKVNFLNTQLDLRSGEVEIINRDVYITLEAETEILTSEYEKIPVRLTISRAKIENIQPKLYTPVYSQLTTEEITALMLGAGKLQKRGDKVEVYASERIDYLPILRTQFLKLIDITLAEPISRNILQKWGIADKFVISQASVDSTSKRIENQNNTTTDRAFSAVDIVKDTKYGIEKYLTPDMAIGYSVTLAEIQNRLNLKHEIELSYRLKNNIFIKGIYDYAIRDYNVGKYSGDIKIQLEPRFRLKSWSEEEKEQQK
ncbi:MAG: translocation/assembly module TamB domain-containing protein [Elusimicrobiota bacterium]|nr:translocation/assembly module TamB domain-containing protein [Elusimicrobiota bacterium]